MSDAMALGRRLAAQGRKPEAVAALVTAARCADDAAEAAELLVESVYQALMVYGPDRALELAREAVDLARGGGGATELRAVTRLGDAFLWAGRYVEAAAAWQEAGKVSAPMEMTVACERANALLRSGELAACRETAYEGLALARTRGDRAVVLDALGLACVAEIQSGLLQEALLCAEQAVDVAGEDAEDPAQLPLLDALGLLAWVTALLGDVARCRDVLSRADRVAGGLPMTAPGGLAAGMLAMGIGDLDAAIRAFESKLRQFALSPAAQACGPRPFVPSLVEAYARAGQADRARALIEGVLPAALETGQPRLAAPAMRAHAVAHDDSAAFAEAHRWHQLWGNLFEEGRTFLAEGELLRRQKHREQARRALRAALDRFEHAGAVTWQTRAVTELRAAGDRSAGRAQPVTDDVHLTAQESAIVELVVAGLSNRELAGQLFLSVKTVEGHLTAIYDKYGVRSRGQLVAAVSRGSRA